MSESPEQRRVSDNPEAERGRESQRERDRYLKLAQENPHAITEEIKKNPKTEEFLKKILGEAEYNRIKDLNPNSLSEDTDIAKMQKTIYEFVDINPDTDRNSTKNKFLKGLIDSIIVENTELAMKIIETKGAILLDMIEMIFSLEGLKKIANGIGTSIIGIFSGDAYKTGKSVGELGLVTTGAGAGGFALKKIGKGAMRAAEHVTEQAGGNIATDVLHVTGRSTVKAGEALQVPYRVVEAGTKKVAGAVKDSVVAVGEKTGVNQVVRTATEGMKQGAREVKDALVANMSEEMKATITNIRGKVGNILDQAQSTIDRAKAAAAAVVAPVMMTAEGIPIRDIGREAENGAKSTVKPEPMRMEGKEVKEGAENGTRNEAKPESVEMEGEEAKKNRNDKPSDKPNNPDFQRQIDGLRTLGFPEDLAKDILESGLNTPLRGKEKFDLLERYEFFRTKGVDYETMLKNAMEKVPGLTKEDALMIFTYTDYFLYGKLNSFMRGDKVGKEMIGKMTKEQAEASARLVKRLESALEKMPELKPGENGFILRGDHTKYWEKNGVLSRKGDEFILKSFTSVSNTIEDSFIGKYGKDAAVYIIPKEGRVKDISSLAIAVNFGGPEKQLKGLDATKVEGVLLSNSMVVVLDEIVKNEKGILIVKVKQTQ